MPRWYRYNIASTAVNLSAVKLVYFNVIESAYTS